jgi:hypothetical protein
MWIAGVMKSWSVGEMENKKEILFHGAPHIPIIRYSDTPLL